MWWPFVLVCNWDLLSWWWNCRFKAYICVIIKQYPCYLQTPAVLILVDCPMQCCHTLQNITVINLLPPWAPFYSDLTTVWHSPSKVLTNCLPSFGCAVSTIGGSRLKHLYWMSIIILLSVGVVNRQNKREEKDADPVDAWQHRWDNNICSKR